MCGQVQEIMTKEIGVSYSKTLDCFYTIFSSPFDGVSVYTTSAIFEYQKSKYSHSHYIQTFPMKRVDMLNCPHLYGKTVEED